MSDAGGSFATSRFCSCGAFTRAGVRGSLEAPLRRAWALLKATVGIALLVFGALFAAQKLDRDRSSSVAREYAHAPALRAPSSATPAVRGPAQHLPRRGLPIAGGDPPGHEGPAGVSREVPGRAGSLVDQNVTNTRSRKNEQ